MPWSMVSSSVSSTGGCCCWRLRDLLAAAACDADVMLEPTALQAKH